MNTSLNKGMATNTRFRYAKLLYSAMLALSHEIEAAELTEYGYPAKPGEIVRVYEGHISIAGQAAGLATQSIYNASALLQAMEATLVLRRSTKRDTSLTILTYEPSDEDYKNFGEHVGRLNRHYAPNRVDALKDEIELMKGHHREQIDLLRDEIDQLERRIAELEVRVLPVV